MDYLSRGLSRRGAQHVEPSGCLVEDFGAALECNQMLNWDFAIGARVWLGIEEVLSLTQLRRCPDVEDEKS